MSSIESCRGPVTRKGLGPPQPQDAVQYAVVHCPGHEGRSCNSAFTRRGVDGTQSSGTAVENDLATFFADPIGRSCFGSGAVTLAVPLPNLQYAPFTLSRLQPSPWESPNDLPAVPLKAAVDIGWWSVPPRQRDQPPDGRTMTEIRHFIGMLSWDAVVSPGFVLCRDGCLLAGWWVRDSFNCGILCVHARLQVKSFDQSTNGDRQTHLPRSQAGFVTVNHIWQPYFVTPNSPLATVGLLRFAHAGTILNANLDLSLMMHAE